MELEPNEPPKWLSELEQRLELLKKHKLQHEVGSGAACLKCQERCPGLELHFWRKICTNCKCSVNDHYTEESSDALKFEILTFKKDAKNRPKCYPKVLNVIAEKSDNNDKLIIQKRPSANSERKEVEFDWVPNVPSEMALEYMASLPSEKLPIKDTPGSVNRKQLWKTQIPLTDIAPHHMAKMDNCEKLRFQNFLETLRNEVVGQGRVQRIHVKPFIASSSLSNKFQEPQSSRKLEKSHISNDLPERYPETSLKLPSFYYNKRLDEAKEKKRLPEELNLFNKEAGKDSNIVKELSNYPRPYESFSESTLPTEMQGVKYGSKPSGYQPLNITSGSNLDLPMFDKENNTHSQNKFENPSNYSAEVGKEKQLSDDNANKLQNLHLEDAENNNEVTVESEKDMQCVQCQLTIESGSVVVTTKHGGVCKAWHPQCFVCTVCQELLVDLMYFFLQGKVYCLRHYAAEKKLDRCNACDELIFSDVFTMAPDMKAYHYDHFCCFECDSPLGGKQYVEMNNQPVCLDCYNKVYAIKCKTCDEIVEPNEQRISHNNCDWHARPKCFLCANCAKPLLNQRVVFRNNNPFCSSNCVTIFTNKP